MRSIGNNIQVFRDVVDQKELETLHEFRICKSWY